MQCRHDNIDVALLVDCVGVHCIGDALCIVQCVVCASANERLVSASKSLNIGSCRMYASHVNFKAKHNLTIMAGAGQIQYTLHWFKLFKLVSCKDEISSLP